ncbi:hypothetical protein Trydic_g1360 [Trypoxylus dichotomus]
MLLIEIPKKYGARLGAERLSPFSTPEDKFERTALESNTKLEDAMKIHPNTLGTTFYEEGIRKLVYLYNKYAMIMSKNNFDGPWL